MRLLATFMHHMTPHGLCMDAAFNDTAPATSALLWWPETAPGVHTVLRQTDPSAFVDKDVLLFFQHTWTPLHG
jgi:hypothetical protein